MQNLRVLARLRNRIVPSSHILDPVERISEHFGQRSKG